MSDSNTKYRVLARKYRPTSFKDLIGQDALVRTLKNAIDSGRLAQAYILTGIRGVGKTTSARIIARALNCIGADGNGNMTTDPCGVCVHCKAIEQDRHVDVVEIDAASNTGVDNVRELIETTRYKPTSARYKIYIVDEVHMLSKNAFNALLKTLEEPPEQVKFIFATTEIRKVPTTVLSRCQRFDLSRVESDLLVDHFSSILKKENLTAQEEALQLIAKAADGSVRDGLSILDQAIAHSSGNVTAEFVRAMIGLADRASIFDLFTMLITGNINDALNLFESQYALGAEPVIVLQDLLDLTHWVTRVKIAPDLAKDPNFGKNEQQKGLEIAQTLSMPVLTRAWQILLKGNTEVLNAPNPKQAVEMVLIRLAYVSDLPTPAEVITDLRSSSKPKAQNMTWSGVTPTSIQTTSALPAPTQEHTLPVLNSLADVVAYAMSINDDMLAFNIQKYVSLVTFSVGKIEFFPLEKAPKTLANELAKKLQEWTGHFWAITVVSKQGGETLLQEGERNKENTKKTLHAHPLVAQILTLFPQARIETFHLRETEEIKPQEDGTFFEDTP